MHIDDILDELAYSDDFPDDAIRWSLSHPTEAAPEFLKILAEAAGKIHLSEEEELSLFFITHILADLKEPKAFQPLIHILASGQEDLIGAVFGEDRETVPQVLISTYDGDEHGLRDLIESAAVDEFIRNQAFNAWGYLVANGRIGRDAAHEYLVRTYDDLQPKSEHMIWLGWLANVCNLGFEDLLPQALTIFGDGRMPEKLMSEPYLRDEMSLGVAAEDHTLMYREQQIFPFEDVIESLSKWASFREVAYEGASAYAAFLHPAQNDFRDVGRNDPCPCGSGKKFKKCCLH